MGRLTSFSLSDLVKRSAAQILYLGTNRREHRLSEEAREGVEYQRRMTSAGAYAEMAGTVEYQGIKVHFSWDEVIPGDPLVFNEIKMEGEEGWYRQSATLQVATYAAFTELCSELQTAKFYLCQTRVNQRLDLRGRDREFHLKMERFPRKVELVNAARLRRHFLDKALLISESSGPLSYDSVRVWDGKYKWKEWSLFNSCFRAARI